MEELIPFLIFIVIAGVNFLKYLAEKNAKKQSTPKAKSEPAERNQPSTLEEFFSEIAQKFEPKPRDLPEWPETIERPDYVSQMRSYEEAQKAPGPVTEWEEVRAPEPQTTPLPGTPVLTREKTYQPKAGGRSTSTMIPTQGTLFTGIGGQRISTPPLLRSAAGRTRFALDTKKQLKQAILANMVFGPPRAYETSFGNVVIK